MFIEIKGGCSSIFLDFLKKQNCTDKQRDQRYYLLLTVALSSKSDYTFY